jgi:hypothetical protein
VVLVGKTRVATRVLMVLLGHPPHMALVALVVAKINTAAMQ